MKKGEDPTLDITPTSLWGSEWKKALNGPVTLSPLYNGLLGSEWKKALNGPVTLSPLYNGLLGSEWKKALNGPVTLSPLYNGLLGTGFKNFKSANLIIAPKTRDKLKLDKSEIDFLNNIIPSEKYSITTNYNREEVEFTFQNNDSKEEIPVEELTSALAISDIISGLTMDEVVSFYNHLVKFPLLGLDHPVGQRIFIEIKDVPLVSISNVQLFRARSRNPNERDLPLSDSEMFNAPHGKAGLGRFNFQGHGELYVCDDKKTALQEAVSSENGIKYEIIEWKLEQTLNVIDLTTSTSPLSKYCNFQKKTLNGQEYIIPNFLAQCAKYHRIAGIRYNSVKDNNVNNYVFFDIKQEWFQPIKLDVDVG
jgi:RES domain-containing protein